jgi:hypothetical protein
MGREKQLVGRKAILMLFLPSYKIKTKSTFNNGDGEWCETTRFMHACIVSQVLVGNRERRQVRGIGGGETFSRSLFGWFAPSPRYWICSAIGPAGPCVGLIIGHLGAHACTESRLRVMT